MLFSTFYAIITIIVTMFKSKSITERKIVLADNDTVQEDQDSDQFNSMLNAALKHINSQEISVGSLSQEQIEAMLADDDTGSTVNSGGSDDTSNTGDDPEMSSDEDLDIAERFREGISADSQAAAEETEKKEKKKKEKKPKVKKEKKPLDKAQIAKILIALSVVVALVLGFLICLVFFTDVLKTQEQEFAIKAAVSVASKFDPKTEMYVYKAFVRRGSASEECMLYAITMDAEKEKTDMYHVVIYNDSPNTINVYYTIDTESREYLSLHNSDDPEERVYASTLKSYSDAIAAADKEIQIGTPSWVKIDCTMINKALRKPEETAAVSQ